MSGHPNLRSLNMKRAKKLRGWRLWVFLVLAGVVAVVTVGAQLDLNGSSGGSAGGSAGGVPVPESSGSAGEPSYEGHAESAIVRSIVDGDTLKTDVGTVRVIGIDTPERGECGYAEAKAFVATALPVGSAVTLERPDGQRDTDRYDRLLRYVYYPDGVTDLGLEQILAGNAVARYDSRDGYPEHPREGAYVDAQSAVLSSGGSVLTPACGDAWLAPPVNSAELSDDWYLVYPSCGALKRNTVGHPVGPFDVSKSEETAIYEWFANGTGNRGDGDGDGLACE